MKNFYIIFISLSAMFVLGNCDKNSSNDSSPVQGTDGGQGGSLARFCIANDHLYVVDERSLHVYSIIDPAHPLKISTVNLGFGIETIFHYDDFLYIGSNNGMVICSIANPAQPEITSTYQHIFSCDPVVVQGDLAYVTLRTGTRCNRGVNQLEVVDISDKRNPKLVIALPMTGPWGLGVDGKHLFVCDEAKNIVYFDLTNPKSPLKIKSFPIKAMDVIPSNNVLITTGADGIGQYDYADAPNTLALLSKIEIGK